MTRTLTCWVGECDAELEVVDGAWQCPQGHRLRRYEDLNPWVRDHIELMQPNPAMWNRYFDPKGDRE